MEITLDQALKRAPSFAHFAREIGASASQLAQMRKAGHIPAWRHAAAVRAFAKYPIPEGESPITAEIVDSWSATRRPAKGFTPGRAP